MKKLLFLCIVLPFAGHLLFDEYLMRPLIFAIARFGRGELPWSRE